MLICIVISSVAAVWRKGGVVTVCSSFGFSFQQSSATVLAFTVYGLESAVHTMETERLQLYPASLQAHFLN